MSESLTSLWWQEQLFVSPRPGKWPSARILFHLLWYERRIALPSMRQWFGDSAPQIASQEEETNAEEGEWNAGQGQSVDSMRSSLRLLRADQIALASRAPDELWYEERQALWGTVTLQWVTTKTYQHTLEHTDEILRQYLWGYFSKTR